MIKLQRPKLIHEMSNLEFIIYLKTMRMIDGVIDQIYLRITEEIFLQEST